MTRKIVFNIATQDCLDGLKAIPPGSVDVCITSPPYNIKKYKNYTDDRKREDYLKWCHCWTMELQRVLKPVGSFFLNLGLVSKDPLLPFDLARQTTGLFHLQNTTHWIKSISIDQKDGQTHSYGHFKPITSGRYLNQLHEYVFHFTPKGDTKLDRLAIGVPYEDKTNVARWAHTQKRDLRCRGDAWFVPYKTIQRQAKDRPHPATFPTELAVKCIRLHGGKDLTVLDPFLGIGHAALAVQVCQQQVERFIGIDHEPDYIEIARRELNKIGAL